MEFKQTALSEANKCVKCGLCLPFCPTFQLTKDENESPRGRISLIQGLANKQLKPTKGLVDSLEHCLQCRSCENVCPSDIQYGKLIQHTREVIHEQTPLRKSPAILRFIIKSRQRIKLATWLLYLYQKSSLQRILRSAKFFGIKPVEMLDKMVPSILVAPKKLQDYYEAENEKRGEVSLFTGCINRMVEQQNIEAAIQVLRLYGYAVRISSQQCCGALDELSGDFSLAASKANTNASPPILTLATGCLAHIKLSYPAETKSHYQDLLYFISQLTPPQNINFKAIKAKAVIHQPCTHKNALKLPNTAQMLLQQIPELELTTPKCRTQCCGSAGDYGFKFQETSNKLGESLFNELTEESPDLIITTNIGCNLQLESKCRYKAGTMPKVFHPITLLAESIYLRPVKSSSQ